jgi:hypothetical protein
MYPTIEYQKTVKPISSLDVYALSRIFSWITNSTELSSNIICPNEATIGLPTGIDYIHFKIKSQNLPASSQDLVDTFLQFFLQPETLIAVIIVIVLIFTLMMVLKKGKS